MNLKMITSTVATVAFALTAWNSTAQASKKLVYEVTVQNVTANNAISPFLATVLKSGASLFEVGKEASAGVSSIAETGATATLESELAANPNKLFVTKAAGGPLGAGETRTVTIEIDSKSAAKGAVLHVIAMIGKSNDSFISVKLPMTADSYSVAAKNFDAGSEENTGNVGDFGPSGHPIANAEGLVSYDRGLNPRGDAGDLIAWGPVAALVKVVRVK